MKIVEPRTTRSVAPAAAPKALKAEAPVSVAKPAASARLDPRMWWKGRPLSEGRNAHKTNTVEQMNEAMKSGANWLECDLRREQNPPYDIECRHDLGDERGDNLKLSEWLKIGVKSGRGLKLDIKESQYLPQILDELEKAKVPSERLMIPAVSRAIPEIRRRFPDAILTIGSPGGQPVNGKLTDEQVDRMIATVKKTGQPCAFIARYDTLTDSAIKKLSAVAPVSVWNDPGLPGAENPQRVTTSLRARGVNGVIDIRKSESLLDKAKNVLDKKEYVIERKIKKLL